jgi:predicted nucleic acid-binding Zn ribbon protein
MNGNPIWCKPARTREYDFYCEEPEDNVKLLAELPALVRKAMAQGLIQRAEIPLELVEVPGPWSEVASCSCGQQFIRRQKGGYEKCFQCRTPAIACKCCGKSFHPPKRGQVSCSNACRITLIKQGAASQKKDRPPLECPVCGKHYPRKNNTSKQSKTCGRECGLVLMKQSQKQNRK